MKTVVVFKWTRDPQDAIVKGDGSVSWSGVKMAATDDDPAAMDIARVLSDEASIVGLMVGDGKPEWAAARGASSTVSIDGVSCQPDGSQVASAIAAAVNEMGDVDVVAVGDSDWDRAVVCALVGELGWKAYAGVTAVEKDGDALLVTVKGADASKIVKTSAPVLLAATSLGQEENVPGMKQTLAARKKPLERKEKASLGVASRETCETLGTRLPEGEAAVLFDGADPEKAASQLIEALRGEGVL